MNAIRIYSITVFFATFEVLLELIIIYSSVSSFETFSFTLSTFLYPICHSAKRTTEWLKGAISALPALPHKLQGLAVYFYGGAADVEELVADDDFLALDALDERHAAGKCTVGDTHLVALSEGTVDEGGVAGVYDAAEIVELGIGDDVGGLLAGHREHLVYVGTETDIVEVVSFHPYEDEGGEDHELAYAALAATVDYYTPLSGHPGFDRKAATLEVLLYGEHELLLVINPHACHIPGHPDGVCDG